MNLVPFRRRQEMERGSNDPVLSFDDWLGLVGSFGFNGVQYGVNYTDNGQPQEKIGPEFRSLSQLAYRTNGVVFACMAVRSLLFSEARFQYRRYNSNGRPGDLFGDTSLKPLENPWPGGTTGDLLARLIQHVDLAGNAFATVRDGQIKLLRPDWMSIIVGTNGDKDASNWAPDAQLLGYVYSDGGYAGNAEPDVFLPEEIAHFAPYPDPLARFRGMSWITPVIREVMADKAMTEHKLKFHENAGTPNLAVKLQEPDLEKFQAWIRLFKEEHEGVANAYKTLFLGAGADVTAIGSSLKEIDFKVVQGAGETRIAAAAGVPPVIVGLSEGLAAATYSNYELAMRRFADLTMRPLWRNVAGSLQNIISSPGGASLWYDDRDIPALAEDQKKKAETLQANAVTIRYLVDSGFEPGDVISAVTSGDLSRMAHSGLFSVQLQPANAPKQGLFTGIPEPTGASATPKPPAPRSDPWLDHQLRLPDINVNFNDGAFRMEGKPADVNFAEGAFRVEAPAPAEVNVTVEAPAPAETRVEIAEGAIRVDAPVTVEPARIEAGAVEVHPVVNVTHETPKKSGRRHVDLGDGRSAVVTEEDGTKTIEFDDGRTATVRDEDTV